MRRTEAYALRAKMEQLFEKAAPAMTAEEALSGRILCRTWTPGVHTAGEVYGAQGQLWKCIRDYDSAVYPDIAPCLGAWGGFHTPYHGTTRETAMPWVAPTGAHDLYHPGEYMVYTDGVVYLNVEATNFDPAAYPGAWKAAL